jgi:hypothetical protein
MDTSSPTEKSLVIERTLIPKVSFALHQNAVPVLLELAVRNDSQESWEDLALTIHAEPPFFQQRSWQLSKIGPGQCCRIPDLDLSLDGGQLFRLTEAEIGQVTFTVTHGNTVLVSQMQPVELLARNQWGGIAQYPELAAAFVRPNDPAVERILKKAADLLLRAGKETAFTGYDRGGKRRVWEILAAIWQAVSSLGLDYALPPAGFEQQGQKVRSPEQILGNGLGTCLDLSFLFASCLEQCNFHPLLVFLDGHAFAGAWLVPEVFATTVVDDVTALRKRLQLQEIVLFEPTLAVRSQQAPPKFSWSCEVGTRQVATEEPRHFQLALDIRRARMERIRPLASDTELLQATRATSSESGTAEVLDLDDAPDLVEIEPLARAPEPSGPQGRLDRWQRKLLDLSLRNNLLNFRASKRVVELMVPDPGRLEDLLADGKHFKLRPGVHLMEGSDPRDASLHQARHREEVGREHALEGLEKGELYIQLSDDEMDRRLVELFRASRLALQEGGANTLYLVLGFLVWNQDGKDGRRYKAPLILIPVNLARKAVRSGFSLSLHEDEPRFNLTLLEMLRQDFQLHLPAVEGELPRDDSGLDVATIWRAVATAVKDMPGWEVTQEVCLGQFSFAKYLMWKDLTDHAAQLRQNPVVRHLMDTPDQAYGERAAFVAPEQLDDVLPPSGNFCPLPADSSQLAAVVAAAEGRDFVLEGPPGTGKSQTIANLIAQCLALNKTVLFVAEKTAALEVVYRRLKMVGLGEFCLELHSHKANKLEVLKQLSTSWDTRKAGDQTTWEQECARMDLLRNQLNALVQRLHHRWPNGLSVFTAISRTLAGRDLPHVSLQFPGPDCHDKAALDRLLDTAMRLGIHATQVAGIPTEQWALVTATEWAPGWEADLTGALRDMIAPCEALVQAATAFFEVTGLPASILSATACRALGALSHSLPQAYGRDWSFLLRPDAPSCLGRLREGQALAAFGQQFLAQLRGQPDCASPPCETREATESLWPDLETRVFDLAAEVRHGLAQAEEELRLPGGIPAGAVLADRRQTLRQRIATVAAGVKEISHAYLDRVHAGKSLDEDRRQLWGRLSREYLPEATSLDLERLRQDWQQAGSSWWLKRNAGQRAVRKALLAVAKTPRAKVGNDAQDLELLLAIRDRDGQLSAYEDLRGREADGWDWVALETSALTNFQRLKETLERVVQDFNRLAKLQELEAKLAPYADLGPLTAGLWSGLTTKAEDIDLATKLGEQFADALAGLYDRPETLKTGLEALGHLIGENNLLLAAHGAATRACGEVSTQLSHFLAALTMLLDRLGGEETAKRHVAAMPPDQLVSWCGALLAQSRLLRPWCAWNRVAGEALGLGLGPLVKAVATGGVSGAQVKETFAVNYCRWWLCAAVDTEPLLRRFASAEHEQAIADFRQLDQKLADLARDCIRANVRRGVPGVDDVTNASEWGILRREMGKKRRHIPLRQLLEKLPTALPSLTPCLLMSPLSIAQYLPPDRKPFDLVVFDEASQIPVWDAIGAMARGQRVVVVGDPKQLPPTNFFNRAEDEDADDDVETGGDMESILDECLGAGLPSQRLNWHYRSRHESLIAFSNARYYAGGLVTFPSPVTDDRAVSLHLVDGGCYGRGGNRTNPVEAKALVADIVRHLNDPVFVETGRSIGVVTFNSQQQKLIEDLLDEERRRDVSLDHFFTDDITEPVFVKNLENVQGDERDVMYFSITYGPDVAGGPLNSMNFGPLNKDGGERRLNVAVTRAKCALRIFSSFQPEQIVLARTKAKGVADLKLFLEYAQRGIGALAEEASAPRGDFDSPFEEIVAAALSRRGWTVHPQVGVSAFRIDLGVVDPDRPGRYLAGVECDGATYHRAATARDRDRLREQVLRGLGWEIVRTWSTDWWYDAPSTADKLDARLHDLHTQAREQQARLEAERQAATCQTEEETFPVIEPEIMANDQPSSTMEISPAAAKQTLPQAEELRPASYAQPGLSAPEGDVSATTDAPTACTDLLAPGQEDALAAAIREIVAAEGPIRSDVLARRIAKRCGLSKAGSRIREKVVRLATTVFQGIKEDGGVFFWPTDAIPGQWDHFRADLNGETRSADEISLSELAALAREVSSSLTPDEDPIMVMARTMGLQRLRAVTRPRLEKAWETSQSSK